MALPATDGPVAPVSPDPAGGAHFRLMRSVDGFAVLKVRAPAHQAELDTFALRWDRITVRGRVVAPQAPPAAYTAQAVRRGGGAVLRAPLEWDGDRFAFDLPRGGMVARPRGAPRGGGPGPRGWTRRGRQVRPTGIPRPSRRRRPGRE
ncbi:hypothetical protein ACFV5C_38005, partial [Streptomyces sp. NPDC059762]